MYVGPAGVGGSLPGQGVSFSVARDPRVGPDFEEVGSSPVADSSAEEYLQGLEKGQVFRF